MRRHAALLVSAVLAATAASAADEKPDLAVVHRIKSEAFQNGKVMDHLFWLTDANGPRLTGSPGFKGAADWAIKTLTGFGGQNAHLEKWGPFGRPWRLTGFSARLVQPSFAALEGVPKAWCAGTNGPITAELVLAPLMERYEREELNDLDNLQARIRKYAQEKKGKLRGKIVLLDAVRELESPKEVASTRYDDAALARLAAAPEPVPTVQVDLPLTAMPRDAKKRAALMSQLPLEAITPLWERRRHINEELWAFLASEGVAGVFLTDERGDGGLLFAESTGEWTPNTPVPPPVVVITPEHYARLVRLTEKKVPVKVELDVRVEASNDAADGLNVVAELPGTGKKKDEVVMLGAHLDSWHAGTGATDNASGSAVMIEAFRILKALNLPLDRTVRIALWGGEEQGLLGSRAYVKEHFGDPMTMQLKPAHAKLAGYFNLDNGSGKIRGVWLQGNDMVRPIFEQWLSPFKDQGATTLSIRNTGGTDHLSFDSVGLPGFQFIQDPLDYGSRTHHSALDVYDHALPGDLMQASAIVAAFVYQAANRPELLPRKVLPKPIPARKVDMPSAQ